MYTFLAAFSFSVGLILAGSDGPLFPWVNVLGLGIFSLTILFAAELRG